MPHLNSNDIIRALANDKNTPPATRLNAAKELRSIEKEAAAAAASGFDFTKNVTDMSTDDLHKDIRLIKVALSEEKKAHEKQASLPL